MSGRTSSKSQELDRRRFLKGCGASAIGFVSGCKSKLADDSGDTRVAELYRSLTKKQRELLAFPFDHRRRMMASAKWAVTKPTIAEVLNRKQRGMVQDTLRGMFGEGWGARFERQMKDDWGSWEEYHLGLFGEPGAGASELMITGRHATLRADGDSVDRLSFRGPIVYGHAATDIDGCGANHYCQHEQPGHPGNVFWPQAERMYSFFEILDPWQRARSLAARAPFEYQVGHRVGGYDGIAVGSLRSDQRRVFDTVFGDLLSMFGAKDAQLIRERIVAHGGFEQLHAAFYLCGQWGNNLHAGAESGWDNWRLEGPCLVWHFRAAPHVHACFHLA